MGSDLQVELRHRLSRLDLDVAVRVRRETLALANTFGLDYWREHDRDEAYPWEFVKAFADAGWLGVVIPEAYGGSGLGVTEAGLLLHSVGRSGAGTSGASAIHFYIFPLTPVIRHGSEHMKRTCSIRPPLSSSSVAVAPSAASKRGPADSSPKMERNTRGSAGNW